MPKPRAVFLDRDGVLTRDRPDYVKSLDELELLPNISSPLRTLQDRGFLLVVITNQSLIGRGLAAREEVIKIHQELRSRLDQLGCKIDGIYFCPHLPEEKCACRKPEPGLIIKAADDLEIELHESWMIGDQESDVEAARRAGCHSVRIPKNEGKLAEAVSVILSAGESGSGETA